MRLAGFTDDDGRNVSAGAKLAGWLGASEESVTAWFFLRPDDGMKLGGTLVGSLLLCLHSWFPPKRFVPASYAERECCVVYVRSVRNGTYGRIKVSIRKADVLARGRAQRMEPSSGRRVPQC